MAQVVSRWAIAVEARLRARFVPRGICGQRSGTETDFSPTSSFSYQYRSTRAPYSYIT
jgi:hypothetical protein